MVSLNKELLISNWNMPSGDVFCLEIMKIEMVQLSAKILTPRYQVSIHSEKPFTRLSIVPDSKTFIILFHTGY